MAQGFTADGLQVDTDVTLAANADTRVATQKAVREYAEAARDGITDQTLPFTDNTVSDVSDTKHGYAPKHPNDSTKFLNGDSGYTVPLVQDWERWIDAGVFYGPGLPLGGEGEGIVHVSGGNMGTITYSPADADQLGCINFLTNAASAGLIIYTGSDITLDTGNWIIGREGQYRCLIRPVSTTDVRLWCGITNLANATFTGVNNPTGKYAMFRFATDASNTNWWFVVCDGTTVEEFDTGVSAASNRMYDLKITWDGTATNSFTAYIDRVQVAQGTLDPVAGTIVHFITTLTSLGAAVKHMRLAGQWLRAKWPS